MEDHRYFTEKKAPALGFIGQTQGHKRLEAAKSLEC